jgi:glycosyltransferase involved in cell wall biosynthesis
LNKTHRTTVFSYLPDPVNNEDSVTSLGASVTLKKDTKKLNLLISGRISSRKNVHNIIKATQMLPKEISQKIILVIAGEFSDKEYESRVLSLVAEAKNVNVVIENKLFSDKELLDVLKKSDVVFVAYSNFFASSGILGHAVNFSKVVIGATNGVIGKTIRKYNLGALVDPESPLSIKRAVIEVANRHNFIKENALFEQYKNDHSPELFSKTLFESI